MKKLRIALIVLLAALLSLGLFACKKKPDENPAGQVRTVTTSGNLTMHDGNVKTDYETALANLTITATYDPNKKGKPIADKELKAADYTVDWTGVPFIAAGQPHEGTVDAGTYFITVTPDKDNHYNESVKITVTVSHNFQEDPENPGSFTCTRDGATNVRQTITDTFHIGGWHDGVTLGSGNKYVLPWNGASGTSSATSTVGRLDKGMTISLTGRVRSLSLAQAYYYPVLGMANVEDGGSFLQRNDNWSIYDAMANGPTAWSKGGNNDGYANTEFPGAASATELMAYLTGPVSASADYTNGGTLWTDEEWKEGKGTNVRLTWEYTDECVAILTWENLDTNTTRIAKVLMPERQYYHSILHGENVDMAFTEVSVIQSLKLTSIKSVGVNESTYIENTYLSTEEVFKDKIEVTYAGGLEGKADPAILRVFANKTANAKKTASGWKDLESTKLTSEFKSFKVRATIANDSFEEVLSAEDAAKIHIKTNAVDSAHENDLTVDAVKFPASGLDNIGFTPKITSVTDTAALLTVSGLASTLSADQLAKLTTQSNYTADDLTHYVAFVVYADGHTKFNGTPTLTGTKGFVKVEAEGAQLHVVLGVNAKLVEDRTEVVIGGVNGDSKIVVRFCDNGGKVTLSGVAVTSTVEYTAKALNETNKVAITYDLSKTSYKDVTAKKLTDTLSLGINNTTAYFNDNGDNIDNGNASNKNQITGIRGMSVEKVELKANKTLTVEYNIPKFNPAAPTNYTFRLYDIKTGATLVADQVAYNVEFVSGNEVKGEYYTEVSGNTLYIVKAIKNDTDITGADLAIPSLTFSANKGDATAALYKRFNYLRTFNIGFKTNAAGDIDFVNGSDLLGGLASVKHTVFGTLNDNRDTDKGAVVVIAIDLSVLGIRANADAKDAFAFNVDVTDLDSNFWYATVSADNVISADVKGAPSGSDESVFTADHLHYGVTAKKLTSNSVTFYTDVKETAATDHTWTAISGKEGWYECATCGGIRNTAGNATEDVAATNVTLDKDLLNKKVPQGKTLVDTGLTVSFELTKATGGDWGTRLLETGMGNVIITGSNLDPWNNSVNADIMKADDPETEKDESKEIEFPKVPDATSREKTLGTALAGGNCYPGAANAFRGPAYDTNAEEFGQQQDHVYFTHAYQYVTLTVSKDTGIRFYSNGVLTYEYLPTVAIRASNVGQMAELFLSLASRYGVRVASANAAAVNVEAYPTSDVDAHLLYARYKAQFGVPEAPRVAPAAETPTHSTATASQENPIVLGADGNTTPWTGANPLWTAAIKAGDKYVITATQTTPGTQPYQGVVGYFFAGKTPVGNWCMNHINDQAGLEGNVGVAMTRGTPDLNGGEDFVDLIKSLNASGAVAKLTITVDWEDTSKVVFTMKLENNDGTKSVTVAYTFQAGTTGATKGFWSAADVGGDAAKVPAYSIGLGVDASQVKVTSIVKTPAAN